MMPSGMWGRLSNTAGALKSQMGRMAEDVLNTAEEFSQQVHPLAPPRFMVGARACMHEYVRGGTLLVL